MIMNKETAITIYTELGIAVRIISTARMRFPYDHKHYLEVNELTDIENSLIEFRNSLEGKYIPHSEM